MIKIIVRLQTTINYNKLLTIYNKIYNNSAYHNIVAQSFYEKLGYIKEVGYVKLIDKQKW